MIKKCIICGKEFRAGKGNIKMCSDECRKKRRAMEEHNKLIDKGKIVLYQKTCVVCGQSFGTYKPRQKCCSKECSIELNKLIVKDYRSNNREILNLKRKKYYKNPKICVVCGKEFIPNYGQSITCSPDCKKQYKNMKNREWIRDNKELIKEHRERKKREAKQK